MPSSFSHQLSEKLEEAHTKVVQIAKEINLWNSVTKERVFKPKPSFLKVLRSVPGTDQTQTKFTFSEITDLTSKYILLRKDHIFDIRSIRIAIVQNDPLGVAFGVKAFHRNQIMALMLKQLEL